MTDQTIPADKVRELIEHFVSKRVEVDNLEAIHLLRNLEKELLPVQQPTTGLLGRWAKHPEHGDVLCVWDKEKDGWIGIRNRGGNDGTGVGLHQVPLDSLTFPHQATKPEDVPVGEARLVNLNGGNYSSKNVVALKVDGDDWRTSSAVTHQEYWRDDEVTLVCPLVPERPVSDLQAKYDELNAKYREAQERIKELEQASTPRTVTTPEEYDALPVGSQVQDAPGGYVWHKHPDGMWWTGGSDSKLRDSATRTVLRYGWGDEQPKPAWRIEHDWQNLRVGEYIIDKDDDDGTVENWDHYIDRWFLSGGALAIPDCAPFIVFPNEEAATPEAVAEAKKARDKETGE